MKTTGSWRAFRLAAWAVLLGAAGTATAAAVRVELVRQGDGFALRRGGQPYFVKGAGGSASRDQLVAAGGNSFRTWGSDRAAQDLDEAQARGLTVTIGIWLGHEQHGFNYGDPAALARQEELVRKVVTANRDHPALLVWALGNEMEIGCKHEEAMWTHIDRLAKLCKELDPNHPVMTVVAEVPDAKVQSIERLCPSVDILGINTYGGAASAIARYRKAGGTKPCMLTEYGPPGHWETGRTPSGAPKEMTSTRKAAWYAEVYEKGIAGAGAHCLGSYVFAWGSKVEATPTWYGLFLKDGSRLNAIDAMAAAWGGKAPANRCPTTGEVAIDRETGLAAGDAVTVSVEASDPDGDPLAYDWVLYQEGGNYNVGGEAQPEPPSYPDAIASGQGTARATVKIPGGGVFRLYAYVRDGHGNAAYANVPLKADGAVVAPPVAAVKMPFAVYSDDQPEPWVASGYMGGTDSIRMDPRCTTQPFAGANCLRVEYVAPGGWAGVLWQSPANDWGKQPGGFNLTGATTLEFRARGENGGEKVSFQVGGLGKDAPYYDTDKAELKDVILKKEWTRYRIPLDGRDLSRIKTGFGWVLGGQGHPVVFYLDDIRYTAE